MSKRSELRESLEDAAIAGAKEMKEFLATYRGKDPDRLARVKIAAVATNSYTRWQASQNNMITGILMAARQVGVSSEQTLEVLKTAGMLPESIVPERLKLAK